MTKSDLNILFIAINYRPEWTKEKTLIFFPLGLCNVASETKRAGYSFDILDLNVTPKTDEELKDFLRNKRYDVIAVAGLTHSYGIIKNIVRIAKEAHPDTSFVIGDAAASSIPELLLEKAGADIAVIGEGRYTFVDLLRAIENGDGFDSIEGIAYLKDGKTFHTPVRTPAAMDSYELPIWDIFEAEEYICSATNYENMRLDDNAYVHKMRPLPIHSSKGCPFRCTFCENNYFHKANPWRYHSPQYLVSVIKAMKERHGINYLYFWDDLTFFTPEQSEPLLQAIIDADLGVRFSAIARVGLLKKGRERLAEMLRDAGCAILNYSLESASPDILKVMNKHITAEQFAVQKRMLDRVGIASGINIVLGYPQETEKTIDETFKLLYDVDGFPSVGYILPIPNTPIFDYAVEKGLIGDIEEYVLNMGERQFLKMNMTGMTDERFQQVVHEHLRKIRDKMGLKIDDEHLICGTVLDKED